MLELVEGPTLADRIAQGAIPIDEALSIAKQIAEALEAAHEAGVIHRDLKPTNIKVKDDGTVKVLDFGLAKALDPTPTGDPSQSPTLTAAATQMGVILGTAAYMSPEQATGKPVDRRSDLWAFGVVLLEMLTGRPVFEGETVTDVLASVLKTEPDWTTLPNTTPLQIRTLLRRCLQRDRASRWDSAVAARLEIEDALSAPLANARAVTASEVASPPSDRTRLAWAVAAVATVIAVALAIPAFRHLGEVPPPAARETRTEILTPAASALATFALSPDGRHIAFVASGDGPGRLWLRSLDATTVEPLEETEGAAYPFWSPDGRSLAFMAGGALQRLDLGGGTPRSLEGLRLQRINGRPAVAISPNGEQFVYNAGGVAGGLYVRSMDELEARFIPGAENPENPVFSPDGQEVAYYQRAATGRLMKIAVSGGAPVTLSDPIENPFGMSWESDGTILFGQSDGIWSVSESGGEPDHLIVTEPGEQVHGPQLLPGGEWILFTFTSGTGDSRWDEADIVIESLSSGERRIVRPGGSDARYVPTGHLVYAFGDGLFALPFDADSLELSGGPTSILQGVLRTIAPGLQTGVAFYGFSDNGTLVYFPAPPSYGCPRWSRWIVAGTPSPSPAKRATIPDLGSHPTAAALPLRSP